MGNRSAARWVVVTVLALVIAGGLAALLLQRPPEAAGGSSPSVFSDESGGARQAYPLAAAVAREWQSDARLAVVTAHWRPHLGRWPNRVEWTFQFYSLSTQRTAAVVVSERGARLLREALSPYPISSFAEEDWRVDSPQALEAWLEAGGAAFVARYAQAEVSAQLRASEAGRPVWTIIGIAGEQVWSVSVDGLTGEPEQD